MNKLIVMNSIHLINYLCDEGPLVNIWSVYCTQETEWADQECFFLIIGGLVFANKQLVYDRFGLVCETCIMAKEIITFYQFTVCSLHCSKLNFGLQISDKYIIQFWPLIYVFTIPFKT